ncbi:serglycin isoform X1 [Parambassis ranga]|uniref:Serglycin isoform X1 n=1 Tax=Parambassis ranga TaxID=210632 RepID=A0A6P7I6B9_9TELE|nr:serglycin-like isoform X1 [Parambassis ranga]
MKLILLAVLFCLALHNGKGAPRTAVYKFVRCNPDGDRANCVTLQSPKMAWTEDLPAKLPASTAQYLEAEPVEDESPLMEEEEEEPMEEDETQMISQEGEPPMAFPGEEGSGSYEGSGAESPYMADMRTAREAGSGESWPETDSELTKVGDKNAIRRLFPSRSLAGEAKPAEHELKEDHLLQL